VALGQLDGRTIIASGGNDTTVRLWDAATGTPIGDPSRGVERLASTIDLASPALSVAFAAPAHLIVGAELGIVSLRLPT